MMPEISLLGICGSPVRHGNVAALLDTALRSQDGQEGVSHRTIDLAEREVGDCLHCNWCLRKQTSSRRCSIEDGMADIYPLLEEADAVILATPVYFGRLSGHLAAFIDRMRIYVHGNITAGRLRNKVGGSIAVAWFRFAGPEMALLSINQFFYAVNMVIASPDIGLQGGFALSSLEGSGRREGSDRHLALKDELGVASAVSTISRAVELSRLLKAGTFALKN